MDVSRMATKYTILALAMWIAVFFSDLSTAAETTFSEEVAFVTDEGDDLRALADRNTRALLQPAHGVGAEFGPDERSRYCALLVSDEPVQWVVNDLRTGRVIARSHNAEQLYFGASVSKLFVAAAFLEKHGEDLTKHQLSELVRMIVVSSNSAWLSLQRQTGSGASDHAGRVEVQAFVNRMGYQKIKGFQGWIKHENGTREHGNELNSLQLAHFLSDTYQGNYPGAEILWEIMQATRTGSKKINKYTPANLRIGGKTGTYSGPNASPETIKHATIGARNHAAVLFTDRGVFGISILTNTFRNEDVAILGGGLMREHLGIKPGFSCS